VSNYHKLYTAQDSAIVFIDYQPQMIFGVANADRATLLNNVTLLAKCAKEFNVPTVITSVESEGFSGYVVPQLLDVFPGQAVVERTSMNSWDDAGFRKAIEATGRKNIIMTVYGRKCASLGRPSKCSARATTFTSSRIAAARLLPPRKKRLSRAWCRPARCGSRPSPLCSNGNAIGLRRSTMTRS